MIWPFPEKNKKGTKWVILSGLFSVRRWIYVVFVQGTQLLKDLWVASNRKRVSEDLLIIIHT